MKAITLDREQREALRRELELDANGWGDFAVGLKRRDRAYVHQSAEKLRLVVEAMDAIGWTEQADTPDELPVQVGHALRAWAQESAESLARAFDEFVPADVDLDAYRALCAMGGGE